MEIRVVEKKRKFKCLFHLQGAFHFATWRCDNVVNFAREGPRKEFVDEDYFISKNHRKDTRKKKVGLGTTQILDVLGRSRRSVLFAFWEEGGIGPRIIYIRFPHQLPVSPP